ncbi:hypothetical protein MY11210_005680 [Beauveria gryllotalpidicola]
MYRYHKSQQCLLPERPVRHVSRYALTSPTSRAPFYSAVMMPNSTASTPALQLAMTALPLSVGLFVGVAPPPPDVSVANPDEPAASELD